MEPEWVSWPTLCQRRLGRFAVAVVGMGEHRLQFLRTCTHPNDVREHKIDNIDKETLVFEHPAVVE